MRRYYETCPYCGANLDPGEHCDCEMRHKNVVKRTAATYAEVERRIVEEKE